MLNLAAKVQLAICFSKTLARFKSKMNPKIMDSSTGGTENV